MTGEQGDVLEPLTERREVDDDLVQAVEKILPELPRPDHLGQIPVGRGQDPDVDVGTLVGPEGAELTVLDDAEKLGLDGHRDLGDLVEEDRPAVGLIEKTALVLVGPVKAPFL